MKLMLNFSLLVFSTSIIAQAEMSFTEYKKQMIDGFTKPIESMQATRTCVKRSKDFASIKKCYEPTQIGNNKIKMPKAEEKKVTP